MSQITMLHVDDTSSSTSSCATPTRTLSSTTSVFSTSSIRHALLEDNENFEVICNKRKRATASCWNTFGFPAKVKNGKVKTYEVIPGFVSCKICFDTYKYIDSSTANLYGHRCHRNESSDQTSISSFILSPRSKNPFSKNQTTKKEDIKKLCTRWVVGSMRSFRIVDDPGFKRIIQECLDIGKECRGELNLAAEDLLPSDRTVKNELQKLACDMRNKLKCVLLEAVANKALTISPDNWIDKYRGINYMGATAHFVDENLNYYAIDLFCVEIMDVKKTAENIYQLMESQLAQFGLDQYMDSITFVTDRGSNFIKAFRLNKVLFCVAHRLNNILKRCFYQTPMKKKKNKSLNTSVKSNTTITEIQDTPKKKKNRSIANLQPSPEIEDFTEGIREDESDDQDEDDDGDSCGYDDNGDFDDNHDYKDLTINQLPNNVREILNTIKNCKSLSGLNRQLQLVQNKSINEDSDGDTSAKAIEKRTLHQSSIVRWLSLCELLESIKNAYPSLVILLNNNKQNYRIQKINMDIVEKLIEFFYPWKTVLIELQKTNAPSLFLVLPCITYLRNELSNGDRKERSGMKFFYKRALQLLSSMFNMGEDYIIGAFLHPNYKQLRGASSTQIADCYTTCRLLIGPYQSSTETNEIIYEPQEKKAKIFMSTLMDKQKKQQSTSDEVDRYISLVLDEGEQYENPLDFWKKKENQVTFPNLSRMARKYFSIPCSSSAVERQFSATGQIITQRRSSLDPSTVNDIIFLRSIENKFS
ncbi:unnamed protein product [Rotaria sp. Silwood1]|nr:unnamed protein product [Rotaria sp. Silwood1]